jgi:glycosyltransferase involved in cell wall biosynthesis
MYNGLTVHIVCKNEEHWIWYAIKSVLDCVDRVLVYDTGSTDNTVEIIRSIKDSKIELTEYGSVSPEEFTKLRQKQIDETKTEWFMVLDGDEIWESQMLQKVVDRIKDSKDNILAAFVHYFEFVNDIKHYYMGHEQIRFPLHNRKEYGWYAIRFAKKIPHLVCERAYGLEGYFVQNKELQRFGKSEDYLWCDDVYYFHSRNLLRSSSNEKDNEVMLRIEKRHFAKIGEIPKIYRGIEVIYPQVFSIQHPSIVPNIRSNNEL